MQTNCGCGSRRQQWADAHERAEQRRTPDLFGWWLSMQTSGRLDPADQQRSMLDQLRTFNATQIAPLPFGE
ncbi:hypothetical protein [Caballeronia zhejiangensis]|uniref:hypothetical protein n=1 Tax=Caballeronia zhejiangensis TaxID=871203 RepID=UPI00158CA43D|nr:hypothetical protein [Caballeronia zhejiangensis]MCG7403046.1 hypothetical protein [Caballeronia zhejiangensis]MCI1043870.1 hypothetical protein [Caballeronia zhejiangensis]